MFPNDVTFAKEFTVPFRYVSSDDRRTLIEVPEYARFDVGVKVNFLRRRDGSYMLVSVLARNHPATLWAADFSFLPGCYFPYSTIRVVDEASLEAALQRVAVVAGSATSQYVIAALSYGRQLRSMGPDKGPFVKWWNTMPLVGVVAGDNKVWEAR